MVLLYRCSMEPWIKGLKNTPCKPDNLRGYTPYSFRLMPNCISTQNTIQMDNTATRGATITELENLNEPELIRSQNQTSRHNIKFIQIVRWQMKILPLLRTTDHQIYFIFDV